MSAHNVTSAARAFRRRLDDLTKAEAALKDMRAWLIAVRDEVPDPYEPGSKEEGWLQVCEAGLELLAEHGLGEDDR